MKKTKNTKHPKYEDDDEDFDKKSEASDISINTDNKVFNGAMNKIAKVNKLHNEKEKISKNIFFS